MKNRNHLAKWALCAAAAMALVLPVFAQDGPAPGPSAAQARHQTQRQAENQSATMQAPSEQDVAEVQAQFLKLLRLSPVLTTVVARDPSLLSDQDYVARNNPELAQYMAGHPDIAKNPDFYLFSNLERRGGRREQALERAVWPDLVPQDRSPNSAAMVMHEMIPLIVPPIIIFIIAWLIYAFVQNHRWNRTFKQQAEVHSRLIDKFSTNQELAAYMETEAGKRFLEMSPLASGPAPGQHMPNVVARVITPMQVGIVLTLLGIGLFFLRYTSPDMSTPMAVLATLALMPGIGFILSAGATWAIAQRLGLMPEKNDVRYDAGPPTNPMGRQ